MTAYGTKQGLGYLAKSFWDAGVIDEVLMVLHGRRRNYPEWYNNKALPITTRRIGGPEVDKILKNVDLMLFFETPFDWEFPNYCNQRGVKTVCIPMYEWYPRDKMGAFDHYLCPSLLDAEYFPGHPVFQPPVDPGTWRQRTVAEKFLHNAGNVGHKWHKGTLELLQAMQYVKSDLTLTVRAQDTRELRKVLMKVPEVENDPRVQLELGEIPREDLFKTHDVYIAPEKLNGLSLPLQEAYAAGMLVMTSSRYPNTCYLPQSPLIPVESYHESRIGPGYLSFQEAVMNPRTIARCMDTWYGEPIDLYSEEGRKWGLVNSWDARKQELLDLFEDFVL